MTSIPRLIAGNPQQRASGGGAYAETELVLDGHVHDQPRSPGVPSRPRTAVAAATAGDTRWVRAPGP